MERQRREKRTGFTIVELLTVMGIIAILIGLLVPALTLVRDYAKNLEQSAQFHSVEVGLDTFNTPTDIGGMGFLPPSSENFPITNLSIAFTQPLRILEKTIFIPKSTSGK